jgi:hypothetical protein
MEQTWTGQWGKKKKLQVHYFHHLDTRGWCLYKKKPNIDLKIQN